MILERSESSTDGTLTVADGEAGRGIYAFVPSRSMSAYYGGGRTLLRLETVPGAKIVDLTAEMQPLLAFANRPENRCVQPGTRLCAITRTRVQRHPFILAAYLNRHHPGTDLFIVPHAGPGIPTGKQAVIMNPDSVRVCSRK